MKFEDIGKTLDEALGMGWKKIEEAGNLLKEKFQSMSFENVSDRVKPYLEKAEDYLGKIDFADISPEEKVNKVITYTSALCGAIAVAQPFPIADFFLLTPVQIVMVMKIGQINGFELTKKEAKAVIFEIASVIGWGLLARTLIITGYKTFIPFLGGLLSFPLVFGATYAMGKAAQYYFEKKKEGAGIEVEAFKELWKNATAEGRKLGEEQKDHKLSDDDDK